MTMDEQKECEKAVLDSPLFRQKLEARCGVVDMALVPAPLHPPLPPPLPFRSPGLAGGKGGD